MSWPVFVSTEVDSGDGAKYAGQHFFDRVDIAVTKRTTWHFAETNMTTTLGVLSRKTIWMPQWALTGAVCTLSFLAQRDGAVSGNASVRLSQGATVGTTLVTALTTSYAIYSVSVTAPDDTWADALVVFDLEGQRPASGVDADWNMLGKRLFCNFQVAAP